MTGKIASLYPRGFGFIECADRDTNVYFHATGLIDGTQFAELQEGMTVDFDMGVNKRDGRERAVNVTIRG